MHKTILTSLPPPPPTHFINASETEKLEGGEELPTGNWVLYYKTNVQVGGAQTSYKIYLKDSKGLTSSEILASTSLNKALPVKLTYDGNEITSNTEANPYAISASVSGTVTLKAESSTQGATIKGNKTKLGPSSETTDIEGHSPFNISLEKTSSEDIYKLVLYAIADNFDKSEEKTYYIKLTDTVTINGNDTEAWKKLKEAAKGSSGPSTIIINGTIKATSTTGNNGEITIGRNITIKSGGGTAVLDANCAATSQNHRIFNIGNSKKLTLENLTLKGAINNNSGSNFEIHGGAIFADDDTTLSLTNVIIQNCKCEQSNSAGGGIASKGKVTLNGNSQITGCMAKKSGGGVFLTVGANLTMEGSSSIKICSAPDGGGVHVYSGSSFTMLENSSISDCFGSGNGKGVCLTANGGNRPQFTMQGSAKVDQNNDVYLPNGNTISVGGTLSQNPAAKIKPQNYNDGIQVLTGPAVSTEHTKFTVTPNGVVNWTIDTYGKLKKL